jgi:hypothetical protein
LDGEKVTIIMNGHALEVFFEEALWLVNHGSRGRRGRGGRGVVRGGGDVGVRDRLVRARRDLLIHAAAAGGRVVRLQRAEAASARLAHHKVLIHREGVVREEVAALDSARRVGAAGGAVWATGDRRKG